MRFSYLFSHKNFGLLWRLSGWLGGQTPASRQWPPSEAAQRCMQEYKSHGMPPNPLEIARYLRSGTGRPCASDPDIRTRKSSSRVRFRTLGGLAAAQSIHAQKPTESLKRVRNKHEMNGISCEGHALIRYTIESEYRAIAATGVSRECKPVGTWAAQGSAGQRASVHGRPQSGSYSHDFRRGI